MLPALTEAAAAVGLGETGVVVGHGASLRTGLLAFLKVPAELGEHLRGARQLRMGRARAAG